MKMVEKLVTGVKVFIFSIVVVFMLVVFSPMVFTDKETYAAVNVIYDSYSLLYTGGDGLEYAIVMQAVMDTADDFINSYQDEAILKSKQYTTEYNAVQVWKDLKYNGKDKTLKRVSDIMCTFDYAPAKAASDLKMLFNGKIIKTTVNAKAVMYNIRFAEPIFYIILRLLAVLSVLGAAYLILMWDDLRNPYDEYDDEEYDEYDEFGEYIEEQEEEDEVATDVPSSKEKFDEGLRARRIRMR